MRFNEICALINDYSISKDFKEACLSLEDIIFKLSRKDLLGVITEIGIIPESIPHDSTEEKLFSKVTDCVLAKAFMELGMSAIVVQERTNSADIEVKSKFHNYSFVADAKSFRLSRTAKNQKDYKVTSMSYWKGEHNYSVLVAPYYHYPKKNSQIYGQAFDSNVSVFSWELLYFLINSKVKESHKVNLSEVWNQSNVIAQKTTVAQKNTNFLEEQNTNICSILNLSTDSLNQVLSQFREKIIQRSEVEITYWNSVISEIESYSKEKAIEELLIALKLNEKINTIQRFANSLS